ncbi:MAG: gliding motility-associated C-terminal domain-containing protein [Anaerolineae bacterium]|nr:gliding motility-associated C-terminal domain-containing protein [Anaerolineae bacterium]
MTIRFEQTDNQKQGLRRRATSRGLSFGPIATAITVGTVAVLLGVTFIGDWLRTPKIAAEASPSIISPNGDQTQDTTNFSYTLNEDAEVTVAVFNESGTLVRTINSDEFQTRGQHIAVWDGRDDIGQVAPDGRYRLQVTAQGTVRAAVQSAPVQVDTLPPSLRLVNLDEVSRVREANLTIEGLTDSEAVVQLAGDPKIIPIDSEGHFNIKRQLAEGSNIIQVTATDPAGNIAAIAREIILVTRPPEIAITSPLNDQWTNETLFTVTGVAPPGTTLKVNGQEAAVAAEGQFEREIILQEGDNILRIEAKDDVGNTATQEIIVHRKSAPPTLQLNIEDGETFQQADVQITGKTEAGALVQVNGQAVTVSPLGEFQTTVTLLDGENTIEVAALDQAGNVTQLQRRLNYRVAPPESELARVARNLPTLSTYFVPVLLSLPVLLILAYFLTRPVALVVSAESNSFRPGLPEEGRFLRLSIDLSKAARATVEIKDKRGNTIATLLHRRHRNGGQHTLHWDGYDDFGRVVRPGDYVIQATASTTGGAVTGTLNVSVLEDWAVHRQYLRNAPSQDDSQVMVNRSGEYVRQPTPSARRARRR